MKLYLGIVLDVLLTKMRGQVWFDLISLSV